MERTARTFVAADIGGTKTTVGLFEACDRPGQVLHLLSEETYRSSDHASFEEILALFLGEPPRSGLCAGCFGVSGPIVAGRVKTTNLPWTLEETLLSAAIQAPVKLLNDLEAAAYAMLFLPEAEFAVLNAGTRQRGRGNIAVIAAGTGLGEAMLFYDGERHHPIASEGGHGSFAPTNERQIELLRWLQRRFGGHVSYERVLSGPGLRNIYDFLREASEAPEPSWLVEELRSGDPSVAITRAGIEKRDPVCVETLQLFASVYGSEAGNMALRSLALGGVFVGGGIAPKLLSVLQSGEFMASFVEKGRFRKFAERTHVAVALDLRAPLIGSAHYALRIC